MQGSFPDLSRLATVLAEHGQGLAEEIAIVVATKAPVGKSETAGRLRDSITGEAVSDGGGLLIHVSSDVPEAAYVLLGTAPHEIWPVNKQALMWPEAAHPYRHVHHPGTTANPFGELARQEVVSLIEDELGVIVAEALGGGG